MDKTYDPTKHECPCGVVYDASTSLQVQRHLAAKLHREWAARMMRR